MKKYLLLVRHAESLNNANGNRFSGIVNTPITEKGHSDSAILSDRLSKFRVETVLTSELERSKETAELVFPNVPVYTCSELIEFNYGDYEGISPDDLPEDDAVLNMWRQSPGSMSFPGGQNIAKYADEMWKGMYDLMLKIPEKRIGCIIHKTMGRLFIAKILGLDLNYFRLIPMGNSSVSIVTWDSTEGFRLHTLNTTIDLISDAKENLWNW